MKPQTGHTPGPWEVVEHSGMICVAAAAEHPHKTLCSVGYDERQNHAWRVEEGFYPDNPANARLIAAAPELLEALVSLYEIINTMPDLSDGEKKRATQARAAIALAMTEVAQ